MSHQFAYYASGTHLDPEPKIISELLNAFSGKDLIPTTVTAFLVDTTVKSKSELHFVSSNGDLRLAFEAKRIMLRRQCTSERDAGNSEDFSRETCDLFSSLLETLPIPGHRLAYVVNGLFPEFSEDQLLHARQEFLNDLDFYKDFPPSRWETKTVTRVDRTFGQKSEKMNVLTDINRSQGEFLGAAEHGLQFDRIQSEIDINTTQHNEIARFGTTDVEPFLNEAMTLATELETQVGRLLNV